MIRLGGKNSVDEILEKYNTKLNNLVEDAFQGKGFDYDDYLEMTGQMKNNYAIKWFMQSDLYQEVQDYIEESNIDADDYEVLQVLSTEFAMRLEEKIQDSIPYTKHRRVAKRLKRAYFSLIDFVLDKFNADKVAEQLSQDKEFMKAYKDADQYSRYNMTMSYLDDGTLKDVKDYAKDLAEEYHANESDILDAIESFVSQVTLELNNKKKYYCKTSCNDKKY